VATAVERMRAHRERARRGLRRFTISVSADDLRVIAEHGYEGALSADPDQQAQALSRFITDTLAARRSARVTAVTTSNAVAVTVLRRCSAVSVSAKKHESTSADGCRSADGC
jgi:hypothetical protein